MSDVQEAQEKYEAVISVAAILPPKDGAKSATIVTTEGAEFSLWPEKIGVIRIGEQYQVEVIEKPGKYKTYRNISGTPRHLGPYRAPKEAPKPIAPLQPATTNGKKMDYYQPKPRDPAEQKQIWVCAMLCRDMEKSLGFMHEDALVTRGFVHAQVWEALFGANSSA